tara:strand:+ start:1729 stop:3000 length:1272 start_codon:yes stop_codon:yes gene_type:complete
MFGNEDPYKTYFDRAPLAERLLATTALRIELPTGQHNLAVERYESVRTYIERKDSPLHGLVNCFYPQGSMAIRATIRARQREDGYDIDIVAELDLPADTPPARVLDLLYEAINGEKGSRYHGMTERQTRCVTIYYADGMHLDVTPSVLLAEDDPRRSRIFHAKPEEPVSAHTSKTMNSFAFCEHFNDGAPVDTDFARAYRELAHSFEALVKADADVHPVPAHSTEEGGKSAKVVALQLMKRNRNIRYQSRKHMRMPPSVMLSCLASQLDLVGASLLMALERLSAHVLATLEASERADNILDIRNPKCAEDRFTDRWPENRAALRLYIQDLTLFRSQLTLLAAGKLNLAQMKDLLSAMFGEKLTNVVIDDYAEELGSMIKQGDRTHSSTGRVTPVRVAAAAIASPAIARRHTFYGGRLPDDQID